MGEDIKITDWCVAIGKTLPTGFYAVKGISAAVLDADVGAVTRSTGHYIYVVSDEDHGRMMFGHFVGHRCQRLVESSDTARLCGRNAVIDMRQPSQPRSVTRPTGALCSHLPKM